MKKSIVIMLLATLLGVACTPTTLSSPDGRIGLSFNLSDKGEASYSVSYDGSTIIDKSLLGIVTTTEDFSSGLRVIKVRHDQEDDTWQPVWGERETIRNHNKSLSVLLENRSGARIEVIFKLFDDGLGLRYVLHGEGRADIVSEATEFKMCDNHLTHWVAGNYDDNELGLYYSTYSILSLNLIPRIWKELLVAALLSHR